MVPISVQKNVKAGHSLGWGHLVIEKLPLYDWIHSHRAPPVLVMWFHKAKTEMVKTANKMQTSRRHHGGYAHLFTVYACFCAQHSCTTTTSRSAHLNFYSYGGVKTVKLF